MFGLRIQSRNSARIRGFFTRFQAGSPFCHSSWHSTISATGSYEETRPPSSASRALRLVDVFTSSKPLFFRLLKIAAQSVRKSTGILDLHDCGLPDLLQKVQRNSTSIPTHEKSYPLADFRERPDLASHPGEPQFHRTFTSSLRASKSVACRTCPDRTDRRGR